MKRLVLLLVLAGLICATAAAAPPPPRKVDLLKAFAARLPKVKEATTAEGRAGNLDPDGERGDRGGSPLR
jgi:hypothetical protein